MYDESIIEKAMQINENMTKGQIIAEQTKNLIRIARSTDNPELRQVCITKSAEINSHFVESFVAKYYPTYKTKEEFKDLVNSGMVGLLIALPLYDPDSGYGISAFATNYIKHEISDWFNRMSLGLTTHYATHAMKVKKAQDKLEACGIAKDMQDVATIAEMTKLSIGAVITAMQNLEASNLQYIDSDETFEKLQSKTNNNPENVYFENLKTEALTNAIQKLSEDEQFIINARFMMSPAMSNKDIAAHLNIPIDTLKGRYQSVLKKLSNDKGIRENYPNYANNAQYILNGMMIVEESKANDILDDIEISIEIQNSGGVNIKIHR